MQGGSGTKSEAAALQPEDNSLDIDGETAPLIDEEA